MILLWLIVPRDTKLWPLVSQDEILDFSLGQGMSQLRSPTNIVTVKKTWSLFEKINIFSFLPNIPQANTYMIWFMLLWFSGTINWVKQTTPCRIVLKWLLWGQPMHRFLSKRKVYKTNQSQIWFLEFEC